MDRKFWNWWRQRKHKKQTKDETHLHMAWEQDYHLQDPGRLALFDEYLEMGKAKMAHKSESSRMQLNFAIQ